MKKFIVSALLSLGLTSSVFAAAASSDIILGFKATGGEGSTMNLEFNLGSSFITNPLAAGTTTLLNLNNSTYGANTVSSIYGSNWNSRTDLIWGAVGAVFGGNTGPNGETQRTIWGTKVAPLSLNNGVASTTGWTQVSATSAATPTAQITLLGNNFGGFGTQIGNSYSTLNNSAGAWTAAEGATTADFNGIFTTKSLFEQSTNITGAYVASDFYRMNTVTGQPGTYLGTLAIMQNGDVTFTVIPEPSTYAMILGAMTVGFVALRRRFVRAAV